MLDDPVIVSDLLCRLRLLKPELRPRYKITPSKLRAPARAKEWWKQHPHKRKIVVAQYEARRPEIKQARKARYRSRLLNATGSFTREEWETRKIQFDNRCVYCDRESKRLTPDHYIPLSKGGTNFIDNIVPACQDCNRRKWSKDPSAFKLSQRAQLIFAQLAPKLNEMDRGA